MRSERGSPLSEPSPEFREQGPIPEPQPLDYATRSEQAKKERSPDDKREFRVGLIGGCVCSLVVWSLAFSGVLGCATGFVAFGFVIAKFAVVTVLLWIPGGDPDGIGDPALDRRCGPDPHRHLLRRDDPLNRALTEARLG